MEQRRKTGAAAIRSSALHGGSGGAGEAQEQGVALAVRNDGSSAAVEDHLRLVTRAYESSRANSRVYLRCALDLLSEKYDREDGVGGVKPKSTEIAALRKPNISLMRDRDALQFRLLVARCMAAFFALMAWAFWLGKVR